MEEEQVPAVDFVAEDRKARSLLLTAKLQAQETFLKWWLESERLHPNPSRCSCVQPKTAQTLSKVQERLLQRQSATQGPAPPAIDDIFLLTFDPESESVCFVITSLADSRPLSEPAAVVDPFFIPAHTSRQQ